MTYSPLVVWHDIECGRYTADLPLWRELAAAGGGPVLDVGAGTGRVTLELAAAGFAVTALDREPELLRALAQRASAAGLEVRTVTADARDFALDSRFALIIVPMQTVQLLAVRDGFLRSAAAHLTPGGLLACAVTGALEDFGELAELPEPDTGSLEGWEFASQPTAVRALPSGTRIERVRRAVAPDGDVTESDDAIELVHLSVARLEEEGRAAGLVGEPARHVPATDDHVGSEVVLLRG